MVFSTVEDARFCAVRHRVREKQSSALTHLRVLQQAPLVVMHKSLQTTVAFGSGS